MPHDVVIKDETGAEVVRSEVVTGVAAADVAVPALAAGALPVPVQHPPGHDRDPHRGLLIRATAP